MKRVSILTTLISSVFFNAYEQRNAKGKKTTSLPNKLAGTWRLIEFADFDSTTREWVYPFGKNPKGFFTYTNTGILNLNISSELPLRISQDSIEKYIVSLPYYPGHFALGYFGTYSIDWVKSIVTHHITGGTIPFYIDTDQPRPFIFKGDRVIIGDNRTWKRVLVRAD